MFKFRAVVHLFVIAGMVASIGSAQTSRGTVTGIISDPSGSAVANASVELKGKETGVTRSSTTNESGVYRFDAVDLDSYDLTVKAPGFKTVTNRAVAVQAAQTVGLDTQLEVGDTVSVVEVSAEAVQLQTEAPVRGGNINSTAAVNLPVFSRNPAMLALTLPGVIEQRQNNAGTASFSVNGGRTRSNNFLIDGTENNDISVAGQAFQVKIPEAVQEVSIQTSNYDSEFGRAGGAVINTIIRSGTNDFHGFLGYVLDVTNDDAITNTQSLDPEIQRRGKMFPGTEQFINGGIGGRIIRDKTFFFTSWQEQRQRSTSQANLTTLSAAGKAKLRSLFPQGTNPRADLYLGVSEGVTGYAPFGNIVLGVDPVTGVDRGTIETGTGLFAFAQKFDDRQTISKVDHHFSERDILSVRYGYEKNANPLSTNQFPGFQTSNFNRYQLAAITETHVFSPSLTNELRLPYNRFVYDAPVDGTSPLAQTLPRYTFAPLTEIGVAGNYAQGRVANSFVFQDTVSYVRGRHTFRTGLDLLNQRSMQIAPNSQRGTLTYGATTNYSAFANFLDDFGGGGGAGRDFGSPVYYPRYFRQSYFFQDRWQVNQDLTLTLGVRYENHGTPMNSLRSPAFTGLFNINPRTGTGPFDQPNQVKRDNNNWVPTVGVAYAPGFDDGILGRIFGNKKSVIRAGFNMGYDSFFNNIASNAATSSPNIISTTITSRTSATEPRGFAALSTLLPTTARRLTPKDAQGTLMSGDLVNPYYMRWSFGIQRELAGDVILDTSYVGSNGMKLYLQQDLNPTVPEALRILPAGFSSITELQNVVPYTLEARLDPLQGARAIRTNDGHSSYHSLQTQVTKRFSRGLGLNAAWTWSKLLDNGSDIFQFNNTSPQASLPPPFGGQKLEKAVSLYDRTHRLVLSYLYELPFLRTQQGLVGKVLGGWQIAGITTFESGVPYSVANGADSDGIGGVNRADLNPAGQANVRAQYVGISATNPYGYVNPDFFDTAAGRFVSVPIDPQQARYVGLPAFGTVGFTPRTGNAGRNTERVPGINNWNVNVQKTVRITEGISTEFRTEFYNIWNHPQYGYYSVSSFAPDEGTIASSVQTSIAGRFLNPRVLEAGSRTIRYQLVVRF